MRMLRVVLGITAALCLWIAHPARAADDLDVGDVALGRAYALQSCASCHNVTDRRSALLSILGAPDFYAVANAKTTTTMGLNVFLRTPHRVMPNLIIADDDRRNVVAYIMSLRAQRRPPPKAPAE